MIQRCIESVILAAALSLSSVRAAEGTTPREVKLVLRNPGGLQHETWPMTTGVPFPPGTLQPSAALLLLDERGTPVPIQTRVTSTREEDGSVRWLLLDFQAELEAAPQQTYRLRFGGEATQAQPRQQIAVREVEDAAWQIDTGPLVFEVRRDRFNGVHRARLDGHEWVTPTPDSGPYVVDGAGQVFRAHAGPPDQVVFEERGPLRCVIYATGWFYGEVGDTFCRYAVRIHAYAGQPFVKIFYTLIVTEPTGRATFRDIGFHLPFASTAHAAFGGDPSSRYDVRPDTSVYLLQYDSDKHFILRDDAEAQWLADPPGKQAPGWVRAETGEGEGAVTLACRDFWQQFPKELEVLGDRGLRFHVWPAHGVAKPDREVKDDMLQYLWFCHEGRVLDFTVPESYWNHQEQYSEYEYRYLRSSQNDNAIGLAKTHELLIWFHHPDEGDRVARTVEAWQCDPVIMAEPEWMCASGVFGRLHPYDPERFPDIESGLSRGWDAERRLEAHTRDYGMFHWGDGHTTWDFGRQRWSDVYRCWRAFHHGAPRTSWVLYLRSGDPKYWRHALRNARHCMDIDICHWSRPEYEGLDWPAGKIKGALRDYKGLTHWHAGGRLFDYNCLTDFMLYYYYMTGDHRGMDVAEQWGTAIKQRFGKPRGTRSGAGVTASLIELYKATLDPEYKRIIELHAAHFFDEVQNMDGTVLAPENVAAALPQYKDKPLPRGAFVQWENYAPWIERYYELVGTEKAAERIVAWADAYLEGWGDSWSTLSPNAYVNVLAYAYFISKDPKYLEHGLYCTGKYIGSVDTSSGTFYDGFPHLGQMSLGPGYMAQRIPYFLAALAEHGQPIEPRGPAPGPFALLFSRMRPNERKTEYVDAIVHQDIDGAFRIMAEGGTSYKDGRPIHCEVRNPRGELLVEEQFAFEPGAFLITLDVPADGLAGEYAVRIFGEGSFWRILSTLHTDPELPVAYPIGGKLVRLDKSRYYFWVPDGLTALSVEVVPVGAGAMFSILNPDGEQVIKTSIAVGATPAQRTVRLAVGPGQSGKLWRLEGWASVATLAFRGEGGEIPPFLAVRPEAFFVPK